MRALIQKKLHFYIAIAMVGYLLTATPAASLFASTAPSASAATCTADCKDEKDDALSKTADTEEVASPTFFEYSQFFSFAVPPAFEVHALVFATVPSAQPTLHYSEEPTALSYQSRAPPVVA